MQSHTQKIGIKPNSMAGHVHFCKFLVHGIFSRNPVNQKRLRTERISEL
ncbi:hypothetical protein HMPREF1315_2110 [Bifidobacterium longum subsp. longum 2-2B]|uniref:Transposase n=1 Tax=Bifidobacterium longum subsp. longum 2-2B TaxID=1161745 RepID=A0AAV3FMG3_BIFLL|nr:hypothetical protein HMPREF1315_2110 [Bifidobacterium longum subsp. longum 2-2B]EPE38083.1 hypothetical protein I118_2060 [Bifidobacterium longum D2957]